jgi:hypothetical protein
MNEQGSIGRLLGEENRAARLAKARTENFLGDEFELLIRERNIPPDREIALRELIGFMCLRLRPRHMALA